MEHRNEHKDFMTTSRPRFRLTKFNLTLPEQLYRRERLCELYSELRFCFTIAYSDDVLAEIEWMGRKFSDNYTYKHDIVGGFDVMKISRTSDPVLQSEAQGAV